jgi:hypothetical protein
MKVKVCSALFKAYCRDSINEMIMNKLIFFALSDSFLSGEVSSPVLSTAIATLIEMISTEDSRKSNQSNLGN